MFDVCQAMCSHDRSFTDRLEVQRSGNISVDTANCCPSVYQSDRIDTRHVGNIVRTKDLDG